MNALPPRPAPQAPDLATLLTHTSLALEGLRAQVTALEGHLLDNLRGAPAGPGSVTALQSLDTLIQSLVALEGVMNRLGHTVPKQCSVDTEAVIGPVPLADLRAILATGTNAPADATPEIAPDDIALF